MRARKTIISNIIVFAILIIALYLAYQFYQSNNFNGFVRSEANLNTSEFKRDKEITYSEINSYKITSNEDGELIVFLDCTIQLNNFICCNIFSFNILFFKGALLKKLAI